MPEQSFRDDSNFWDEKLSLYLHDPPDKALHIPGHEDRVKKLCEKLNIASPEKNFYQAADMLASGMDRTLVPGHNSDPKKNGAIDFGKLPVLTHPVANESPLNIKLPDEIHIQDISDKIIKIALKDLDSLSQKFKNEPARFAAARFHYFHHVFRCRLAEENIGGLESLWHRIPADTRIPDHSIWQHCGLVSAIGSAIKLSPNNNNASILVFSIGPVQSFIERARKLRDFWTGSLILSWLAFEGMRWIIYNYGTTNVVYPSLVGQPLVDQMLCDKLKLSFSAKLASTAMAEGVASLPNKFVCLVPTGLEKEAAAGIEESIQKAWQELGQRVKTTLEELVGADQSFDAQFKRQLEGQWTYNWTACPLMNNDDKKIKTATGLLKKDSLTAPLSLLEDARKIYPNTDPRSFFYCPTHGLAQTYLAASKTYKVENRDDEPGIKCSLHNDLEILRRTQDLDNNPNAASDPLWKLVRQDWPNNTDFKDKERLSSVGLIKRIAYKTCRGNKDHPLHRMFKNAEGFPSTTEMAISDWYRSVEAVARTHKYFGEIVGDDENKLMRMLAQLIHGRDREDQPSDFLEIVDLASIEFQTNGKLEKLFSHLTKHTPLQDIDSYYAILLMDGDHMGRLVAGETLAASWKNVLHPDLVKRLQDKAFDPVYREPWKDRLNLKRSISPGAHASISEALADFSLYAVPRIIKDSKGRLIYAGGDDVCAVLPVSTAIDAARRIAEAYSYGFVCIDENGSDIQHVSDQWTPTAGKFALHLGTGKEISISAGILICHHKKPFSVAMREAHSLLDIAKTDGGRNAIAIRLAKRSGGPSTFVCKWNEKALDGILTGFNEVSRDKTLLDHSLRVAQEFGASGASDLSSSLVYRLESFRPGLEAIADKEPGLMTKFIAEQIARSRGKGKENEHEELAKSMASLIIRKKSSNNGGQLIDLSPLLIARFIGKRIFMSPVDERN
jgi:CRISPR-associated protein Cmr2